jgi:hypothetical protein
MGLQVRLHTLHFGRSPAQRGRWLRTIAVVALVLSGIACGKRGAPMPPLPKGPLPPRALAVRQIGPRAQLSFEVPTTRGARPDQRLAAAELVRVAYPPGAPPPLDREAFQRRGLVVDRQALVPEAGARMTLTDGQLDRLASAGEGWTLRYAVRLSDERGRGSPLVVAADLVPLPPGRKPAELTATASAEGVRLSWRAPEGAPTPEASLGYNVYRAQAEAGWGEAPLNPQPLEITEWLDSGAQADTPYRYEVRAVLADGSPRRESDASGPVNIVPVDRFPPSSPEGLVAVQEGRAVRLFWNPSPERDLAGYRLWRRVASGEWARHGRERIDEALFLDEQVEDGVRLAYRVAAFDLSEPPNVSEPSAEVEIQLQAEPAAPTGGER